MGPRPVVPRPVVPWPVVPRPVVPRSQPEAALACASLGGHVLLRFVLAARRPTPSFRFRCLRRSVRPVRSVLLRLRRPVVFGRLHPFNYTWSRYRTNESRSVSRKRMRLRVTGPLRAMKCPSSRPVSTMVPTPLFSVILERMSSPMVAQHSAGVGQLGAAQVDLVVRHHPDELEDLLPAGDEARAQHVHAEGLGRRGGRRSRVVRCVRELLAQLQVVQDQPVAVVGDAQAVRGLAIGGGGKVGADPGGQPGARVGALGQQRPVQRAERGVDPVQVPAPVRWTGNCRPSGSCRRPAGRRSAGAATLPGRPRSRCPRRPPSCSCPRRSSSSFSLTTPRLFCG